MNQRQPFAEAIGVLDDKIIAIGNFKEVKKKLDKDYELVNLEGKSLFPGFIDSHFHIITNLFFFIFLDLYTVKSLTELQSVLKEAAKKKKKGDFILGLRFNEENFTESQSRVLPNRYDLDKACSDNPVFIIRYDGHIGIANSKALEITDINNSTIPPAGGEILKENGNINGILTEKATSLVISKIPLPDSTEINNSASKAFKYLAEKGITSIHGVVELDSKGGVSNLGGIEIPLLKNIKDNVLQDWYGLIYTANPKKLQRIKNPPLDDNKKDGKFKVNCLKCWLDGTFGARTACMFEPFSDQQDKTGFFVINIDELYERMKSAHNLGFQIAIHAIGDKGNRTVVDLYKKLLLECPRENHRHRIEHASMLTKDVLKDVKELKLILSCQPPFINSEYTWLEKRLGKKRCEYTYPFKSIIDAGIILAAGSDGPVENPSVIDGLHAMVNRNGFILEECVSIEEALKAYTINGAYAAFEEDIKGSIEVGKLANFVILDKNLLKTPKSELRDVIVLETIIRGKTVYRKK